MYQTKQPEKPSVQIIRHNNEPVAVVLDIDAYEDLLEAANPRIRREIATARKQVEDGETISHAALMKEIGL